MAKAQNNVMGTLARRAPKTSSMLTDDDLLIVMRSERWQANAMMILLRGNQERQKHIIYTEDDVGRSLLQHFMREV